MTGPACSLRGRKLQRCRPSWEHSPRGPVNAPCLRGRASPAGGRSRVRPGRGCAPRDPRILPGRCKPYTPSSGVWKHHGESGRRGGCGRSGPVTLGSGFEHRASPRHSAAPTAGPGSRGEAGGREGARRPLGCGATRRTGTRWAVRVPVPPFPSRGGKGRPAPPSGRRTSGAGPGPALPCGVGRPLAAASPLGASSAASAGTPQPLRRDTRDTRAAPGPPFASSGPASGGPRPPPSPAAPAAGGAASCRNGERPAEGARGTLRVPGGAALGGAPAVSPPGRTAQAAPCRSRTSALR